MSRCRVDSLTSTTLPISHKNAINTALLFASKCVCGAHARCCPKRYWAGGIVVAESGVDDDGCGVDVATRLYNHFHDVSPAHSKRI